MCFIEAISDRIIELSQKENISLHQLSLLSDVSYSTLHGIISLKSKNVSIGTILKICDVFEITISQFFDIPVFNSIERIK